MAQGEVGCFRLEPFHFPSPWCFPNTHEFHSSCPWLENSRSSRGGASWPPREAQDTKDQSNLGQLSSLGLASSSTPIKWAVMRAEEMPGRGRLGPAHSGLDFKHDAELRTGSR